MNRALLPGLVLLLAGCRSMYEDAKKPAPDPDFDHASIARAQFEDIPVPEGFKLRTDVLQSYSYQCGSFRQGRLLYEGAPDPARAASYLRDRIPQHGWTQTIDSTDGGARRLEFRKGRSLLRCDLRRTSGNRTGMTALLVTVEPDPQLANGNPGS
jgi:hypothetical protein